MILTFADTRTRTLFKQGRASGLPPDIARRAVRKQDYIHFASTLLDLAVPAGNRLHALKGSRQGQHAIRISDQWRICFRFRDGDALEVEVCDYHD